MGLHAMHWGVPMATYQSPQTWGVNETTEQVDQDMTPNDGDYNVVTGAAIAQNATVDA